MADDSQRYLCDEWEAFSRHVAHFARTEELGYALITERGANGRPDSSLGRVDYVDDPLESDERIMYALTDVDPLPDDGTGDPVHRFLNEVLVVIQDNMTGVATMRVRVKLMGHKGNAHLKSKTLVVTDTMYEEGEQAKAPLPGIGPESDSLRHLQEAGEVRERLDSHSFTRRGQELLLASVGQVMKMHIDGHRVYSDSTADVTGRLVQENNDLRAQNRELVKRIESMAISRDREATERLKADANARAIERTVDRSLTILGDAVELGIAAKVGIEPELMKTLMAMSKHPKLLKALKDPRITGLVSDPEVQEYLAQMLTTSMDEIERQQQSPEPEALNAPDSSASEPTAPADAEAAAEDAPDANEPEVSEAPTAPVEPPPQPTPTHPVPVIPAHFLESDDD